MCRQLASINKCRRQGGDTGVESEKERGSWEERERDKRKERGRMRQLRERRTDTDVLRNLTMWKSVMCSTLWS